MVVIPAIIYHPNVEKVCLLLSALKEAVHVEVTLETQTQNHTLVEKDVDKPGIFECVEFKVSLLAANDLIWTAYGDTLLLGYAVRGGRAPVS